MAVLKCTVRYVIASNTRGNPKMWRMVIGPDPRLTTSAEREFDDHDEADAMMKRMVDRDRFAGERAGFACRLQPYAHGRGMEMVAEWDSE